ncbi:hypothetical protein A2154_00145 [Candidatus Gottesmanbacteria bacterium RBG_16_43_7]|uniref:Uncharacterized protein n=1 Tax=Candidatus Gottesmanbacteria bacterium RBG_16_43_7 TaxID=1798373 RepID=A0A1F5ZDB8_9BACT|nr:MAG: hypothetical protein A2154_00145 [Candidatus Gottesmanbacteria bacterium RBG_16_43_7]
MKIQDIILGGLALLLIYKRDNRLLITIAMLLLLISIPLFSLRIFFTAQRLTYFAALFIFIAILFQTIGISRNKEQV